MRYFCTRRLIWVGKFWLVQGQDEHWEEKSAAEWEKPILGSGNTPDWKQLESRNVYVGEVSYMFILSILLPASAHGCSWIKNTRPDGPLV